MDNSGSHSYSPKVNFNRESATLEIAGNSLMNPESEVEFYEPIYEQLEAFFSEKPGSEFVLRFKMHYFNTSASKRFLDLMHMLEEYERRFKAKTEIHWLYNEEDDDMKEMGEEYAEDVRTPFKIFSYEL